MAYKYILNKSTGVPWQVGAEYKSRPNHEAISKARFDEIMLGKEKVKPAPAPVDTDPEESAGNLPKFPTVERPPKGMKKADLIQWCVDVDIPVTEDMTIPEIEAEIDKFIE